MFCLMPDDTDDMCGIIEKISGKIRAEIDNIEIERSNEISLHLLQILGHSFINSF